MTQPAKVQEPSMEQILASIRRIIADDEAKPPLSDKGGTPPSSPGTAKPDKPVAPPANAAMTDSPTSGAAVATAASVLPAPPAPAASVPAAGNSQAALLGELDETSTPEVRPPQPDGEVFELTDAMAVRSPPRQPSFQKVGSPDDVEFTESDNAPAFDPPQPDYSQPILSQSTISAVESSFDTLAHTVLNARTFDDLVREMLRPMLKSWLDDNLPGLVERIVKAEIERVSRGR